GTRSRRSSTRRSGWRRCAPTSAYWRGSLSPFQMQVVVDPLGEAAADARHFREVADAGVAHALQPTELPQELAPALGAQARDFLERRGSPRLRAPLAVAGDREAVCLVANLLHEMQGRGIGRQQDRPLPAGDEELLLPGLAIASLRDRDHLDPAELELVQHRDGLGELPLAAVDEQDVRH